MLPPTGWSSGRTPGLAEAAHLAEFDAVRRGLGNRYQPVAIVRQTLFGRSWLALYSDTSIVNNKLSRQIRRLNFPVVG